MIEIYPIYKYIYEYSIITKTYNKKVALVMHRS